MNKEHEIKGMGYKVWPIEVISNPCTLVVPPNVLVSITGVKLARIFPSGNVQLEYADGNSQSAYLTLDQLTRGRQDFLALVELVKSANGPSTM